MFSRKVLIIINVALSLIILLLILNFVGIELPSVGQVTYSLDVNEPVCVLDWQNDLALVDDLQRCCLESRKQAECVPFAAASPYGKLSWLCQTSPTNIKYWLNSKAYGYCTLQEFW